MSVYVPGYTRSDGTRVAPYRRKRKAARKATITKRKLTVKQQNTIRRSQQAARDRARSKVTQAKRRKK